MRWRLAPTHWMTSWPASSASVPLTFLRVRAISQANGCLACSIYFRNLLKKNGIDFDTFGFTPEEQVLIDYGRAIANDPKHVPEELFTRLKTYFNEEQIVVVTAMGVMMIANNYFNDILDVTPDHLA